MGSLLRVPSMITGCLMEAQLLTLISLVAGLNTQSKRRLAIGWVRANLPNQTQMVLQPSTLTQILPMCLLAMS